MDEPTRLALYSAWGHAFSDALDPKLESCGQDGYEVVFKTFGRALTAAEFHQLSEADFTRMQMVANVWFETDSVDVSNIRVAVERICREWPL